MEAIMSTLTLTSRPDEKLFEELPNVGENMLPTAILRLLSGKTPQKTAKRFAKGLKSCWR
jgi:hypothetical protein